MNKGNTGELIVQIARTAGMIFTALGALCTIIFSCSDGKNEWNKLKSMRNKGS